MSKFLHFIDKYVVSISEYPRDIFKLKTAHNALVKEQNKLWTAHTALVIVQNKLRTAHNALVKIHKKRVNCKEHICQSTE